MRRALTITALIAFAAAPSTAAVQAPDGKALFKEHCQQCHGESGTPPKALSLSVNWEAGGRLDVARARYLTFTISYRPGLLRVGRSATWPR